MKTGKWGLQQYPESATLRGDNRYNAKASKELGPRLDVRTSHNAVLDDGPLPLDLLEQRINDRIGAQKGKK